MKSKIILLTLLLLVFGMNSCGFKRYAKTETVEHRINTTGKKTVKLENVSGTIVISQSKDSASLTIKAVKEVNVKKKYLETPFDEINIRIDTLSSVISISTEINKERSDNIFDINVHRNQRVDYEIRIPPEMYLEIENISGNIVSDDLNNDLKIDLIDGEIDLNKYAGRLECDVTNGDIRAHIDSTSGIEINAINGGITLYLNNYMNANVRAETVTGKISEEQLQFKNRIKEKGLFRGTLGNDDSKIEIKVETVNGKIRLFGRNEI